MMKNKRRLIFWRLAMVATFVAGGVRANLLSNGGFESDPLGTQVSILAPTPVVDSSTFTDWRVFSVGTPPIEAFTVTSTANASVGNLALQLDLTDLGTASNGPNHSLDRDASRISVTPGEDYTLSFDAAWISGSPKLFRGIAEFDAGGNFLGQESLTAIVSNPAYQRFTYAWTPSTNATAEINLIFKPVVSGTNTSSSLLLDNVNFLVSHPVTNGTFSTSGALGVSDDLFQNANISTNSPAHPIKDIADLFTKGSPVVAEDVIYADVDGNDLAYVEFNTAGAINLTNIVIGFQSDYFPTNSDLRAVTEVKVYAASSAVVLMGNLIARVPVNPAYTDTYGAARISLSIDGFSVTNAQYFRVEFTEDHSRLDRGARVLEIDGFGSVAPPSPVEAATIVDWSPVSSNVMRMVVDAPNSASNYYPVSSVDLVYGNWINVPHSSDGIAPFVITNLDYSTVEGTNEVIYVEAGSVAEFYKVIGERL